MGMARMGQVFFLFFSFFLPPPPLACTRGDGEAWEGRWACVFSEGSLLGRAVRARVVGVVFASVCAHVCTYDSADKQKQKSRPR